MWHSNEACRKEILQCTGKFAKGKEKCNTPNLTREDVERRFVKAYNEAMGDREKAIRDVKEAIKKLMDTSEDDRKIGELEAGLAEIRTLAEALVAANKTEAADQREYSERYAALAERFDPKKAELESAKEAREAKTSKAEAAGKFLRDLKNAPAEADAFDMGLWNAALEVAIVNVDGSVTFRFAAGAEIRV